MICPNRLKTTARKSDGPAEMDRPAICEVLATRDNIHILENFIYGDTPGESLRSINCLQHKRKIKALSGKSKP